MRGTARSSREGAPHPGQRGVGRAEVSRRKSLITTGRYNPQGCGMLDSRGSRCQASLKLAWAYRCVWRGVIKFASWSTHPRNESKRCVVRRDRLDPASETHARVMLGNQGIDLAAAPDRSARRMEPGGPEQGQEAGPQAPPTHETSWPRTGAGGGAPSPADPRERKDRSETSGPTTN